MQVAPPTFRPTKAVFLDVDDTLYHTVKTLHAEVWRRVVPPGIDYWNSKLPKDRATVNGMRPIDEIRVLVQSGLVFPDLKPEHHDQAVGELEARRVHLTRQLVKDPGFHIPENDGAVELLRGAKESGLHVGAISSNNGLYVRDLFMRFGIDKYVDFVIGGEDVTNPKPHREPIDTGIARVNESRMAMGMLPIGPENVIMIGDSKADIHGARNAGVRSIWFRNPTSTADLHKDADLVVTSLRDIRPHYGGTFEQHPFTSLPAEGRIVIPGSLEYRPIGMGGKER